MYDIAYIEEIVNDILEKYQSHVSYDYDVQVTHNKEETQLDVDITVTRRVEFQFVEFSVDFSRDVINKWNYDRAMMAIKKV